MSLVESTALDQGALRTAVEALSFRAPYVVERLMKDRIVDTISEGEQLFDEVKRYLVLSELNRDVILGMYSARVDEAWHAFILYTTEYSDFCDRFFGKYLTHAPKNAPGTNATAQCGRAELTFDGFREKYETFFGEPLPDVWYNERSIISTRRVFNDWAGRMTVTDRGATAVLLDEAGDIILSANALARDALEFIARTGAFYVRELPGDLTDDEKVAVIASLTSVGALRVAP